MYRHESQGYIPKADYFHAFLAKNPAFHDTTFKVAFDPSHEYPELAPALVMPPSIFGKRAKFNILEYDPLLDSSNMTIEDWIKIAGDIERFYHLFDAFVILHGTDTMPYTASALSFMLEALGKTVIMTGSQIPLSELRNDATSNLLGALTIAGHYVIPEVTLFFNNHLYRGNRCIKSNLSAFDAFCTPNMKPLAKLGIDIDIDWPAVWRTHEVKPFRARKFMNPNVTCLRLFPGITEATVKAVLAPSVKGVVLETFGAGNAPDNRPDLLKAIKDACDRGVVFVNISQCQVGAVSDIYATGKALSSAGVVPGLDMTTECALTKLAYLLADDGLTPDQVRDKMRVSLAGELTRPVVHPIGNVSSSLSDTYANLILTLPLGLRHQYEEIIGTHFFHVAASRDDVSALKRVMDGDINFNIDAVDYQGSTALHVAIYRGSLRATRWLLEHGASIYLADCYERLPLEITREVAHKDVDYPLETMTELLYKAGAQ